MEFEKGQEYNGVELEPGEEIVMLVRQHWVVFREALLFMLFVPFVLFSAIFFLDYIPLPEFIESQAVRNTIGQIALWGGIGSFVLGVVLFVWKFNLWLGTFYMLTDKRLVLVTQAGLFTHDDRETSLRMIQDVRATTTGLQATLYGYGDVTVQVSSQDSQLILLKVGNPREVQRIVIREAHLKT